MIMPFIGLFLLLLRYWSFLTGLWLFDITALSVAQDWRHFSDMQQFVDLSAPGFN